MAIGSRINYRRTQLGLSRQQLAEMTDIDHRQIWRYEKQMNIPSAEMIASLARALDVSADWLLGLTDEIRPILGKSILQPDEIELLNLYRSKSRDSQHKILDIVKVV